MNLQSVCLCVGMWRYCRSSTADGLSGISPSFINFSCPFVLVQTTVARDGAELDLLCLETLSVTLALSSEMLSLTSLTYDSSSEPCEGNRYTGEWGSAVVQHEQIRTASHSHTRVHCSLPLANKLQQHAGYLSHCSNHESRHCSIHTLYIANKIRSHLKGPCCSHFGWKLLFQFMWQKKRAKRLAVRATGQGGWWISTLSNPSAWLNACLGSYNAWWVFRGHTQYIWSRMFTAVKKGRRQKWLIWVMDWTSSSTWCFLTKHKVEEDHFDS